MTDEDKLRLVRIESKLSQLMLHMGLDPSVKMYDAPRLDSSPKVWRFGESPITKKLATTD